MAQILEKFKKIIRPKDIRANEQLQATGDRPAGQLRDIKPYQEKAEKVKAKIAERKQKEVDEEDMMVRFRKAVPFEQESMVIEGLVTLRELMGLEWPNDEFKEKLIAIAKLHQHINQLNSTLRHYDFANMELKKQIEELQKELEEARKNRP